MAGLISAILRRPSQRTLMEATLTGLTMLLITSSFTSIYMIFFTDMNVWLKVLTGLGGIGILFFFFSNLSLTYVQYYSYKMAMNLYPVDTRLIMKLNDAKLIKKELEELIKDIEYQNKKKVEKNENK